MIKDTNFDCLIKTIVHQLIDNNVNKLSDKSFEEFISMFNDDLRTSFNENLNSSDEFMFNYYLDSILDKSDEQSFSELENFYNNHFKVNGVHETYAVVIPNSPIKHFGINKDFAFMYGVSDTSTIKKIHFEIDEQQPEPGNIDYNSDYWGWFDYSSGIFRMIYFTYKIFSICFPYGVEREEKYMAGKAYKLKILEIDD